MFEWVDAGWKLVRVGGSGLKMRWSGLKMSGGGWERVGAWFSKIFCTQVFAGSASFCVQNYYTEDV